MSERISAQAAPAIPLELGGGISVVAVTDAVADHRRPLAECFPGEPAGGWAEVERRYPETVGADGRWRLPITTFLVRTPKLTVLVDGGVGSGRTIASEVFQTVGSLPDRLARVGVSLGDVDIVFFTHLHEDHVGWANDPDTGAPTFENARYLIGADEWEANHAEGGAPDWVVQAIDPLDERGLVDRVGPGELAAGITVVPLPGHTAGLCALEVAGPDARVALIGDAINHPQQVAEPQIPSVADADRARAVASRREIIERAGSGD